MFKSSVPSPVRRVYWETTAACNLRCLHCRRIDLLNQVSPEEITTQQSFALIDDLAADGKPVLILSGGEPLYRKDILQIAAYASSKKLPVALSTNGTLVTSQKAKEIRESGIYYASISLDGVTAGTHDTFRGRGNFERALKGFFHLKNAGLKVQINFTLTKKNVQEVPLMVELGRSLGAAALYFFLLVPVGCGVQIADSQMLSSGEVEEWLRWIYVKQQEEKSMELRAICAPHFYR
ncbi:MAG: radical SAM protein, partial [Elusimicrobia bacterium]|nr:radical SAM protein [Elusimicrobiota bacterium]